MKEENLFIIKIGKNEQIEQDTKHGWSVDSDYFNLLMWVFNSWKLEKELKYVHLKTCHA